jgi:tRNA(fMet)-specific endonuclease VapC
VVGELYVGAYKSANPLKHIKEVNDFLMKCQIIPTDGKTAHEYAIIKSALLKKGKPIPENDIWIAATSQQYDMCLHTRDKHFIEIDNLLIKFW